MSGVVVTIGLLAVYFALIIWAAFCTNTGRMKENTIEEFALGSRGMGFFIVLFVMMGLLITASTFASWFSWAVHEGMIVQYLLVYSTLGFLFSYVFAKKIWVWGRKFNLITQPDYLELRYRCRPFTLFFGAASILIEAPWVVMEFAAMGKLMNALTYGSLDAKVGTFIIGVVVISYILYSGMKAIAVTELIQGVISSVAIAVGLFVVVYRLWGGFGPLFQAIARIQPKNLTISFDGTYSYEKWSSFIVTGGLGIMGWASFFSRIYTSKSVLDIKRVSAWSAVLSFIFSGVLIIAAMGSIAFPDIVEAAASETAFFAMADKALGPWFLAFTGIVVVAAGMSMVSVIMNSHGVIIAENFIKPFREGISSEERLKAARWSLLIYSVLGIGLALLELPRLYEIALIVYEGIAQVVPMLVFSLYWRRSNKYGAFIGFMAGLTAAILYGVYGSGTHWSGGVIGLVVNVVLHVACGYIFPKDPHVDDLFAVIQEYEEGGVLTRQIDSMGAEAG
ncbi:MAG: sodium:solute symporter family protein [Synergistaceae bacterium]|nr:sodium:solute symporter family protein [Synergistaceae bacterium]